MKRMVIFLLLSASSICAMNEVSVEELRIRTLRVHDLPTIPSVISEAIEHYLNVVHEAAPLEIPLDSEGNITWQELQEAHEADAEEPFIRLFQLSLFEKMRRDQRDIVRYERFWKYIGVPLITVVGITAGISIFSFLSWLTQC